LALSVRVTLPSAAIRSLEELPGSIPLTVDVQFEDGWGAKFPVNEPEIEATILFAGLHNRGA
jgi:hypothetical protein